MSRYVFCRLTIVGLFFLGQVAHAEDNIQCLPPPAFSELTSYAEYSKHMGETLLNEPFMGASEENVKKSSCRRNSYFIPEELENWITDYAKDESQPHDETIHGVHFKNESPKLLELFKKLTTASPTPGTKPELTAAVQRTFASSCTQVLCAAKEIFGEKEGPQLLMMLARYGYNGSPFTFHDTSPWKADELDDVLMALSDLPESLIPFESNRQLVHFTRGTSTHADDANALIYVFEPWDTRTPIGKQKLIFHELGHRVGNVLDLFFIDEYMNLSGWTKEDVLENGKTLTKRFPKKPNTIVSHYGKYNFAEEFAESVLAYRHNPERLKQKSPEKYEFMKEIVFDGLDYSSPSSCDPSSTLTQGLKTRATQAIQSESTLGPDQVTAILKSCKKSLSASLQSEESKNCMGTALVVEFAKKDPAISKLDFRDLVLSKLPNKHFGEFSDSLIQKASAAIRDQIK